MCHVWVTYLRQTVPNLRVIGFLGLSGLSTIWFENLGCDSEKIHLLLAFSWR
jgi:hypothetical protein